MQTMSAFGTDHEYTFIDLDDRARDHALRAVEQAHPCGWDLDDADQVATVMATALAGAFGQPTPGRLDVEVTVWDSRRFSLAGTLHPAIATALPWTGGVHAVTLDWHRRVHLHTTRRATQVDTSRIRTAVDATITTAWRATQRQMRRRQALECIAVCEPRFTQTGHVASHTCPW